MSASASTLPNRKPAAKRKSRKKRAPGWVSWWPLILGIAVTPIAVKAATFLALTGPDGLRLLYPWTIVPGLRFFGLSSSIAGGLSQAMMYLQFPLYGVFAMLVHRWQGVKAAVLQLTLLHLLAVGLVFVAGRG